MTAAVPLFELPSLWTACPDLRAEVVRHGEVFTRRWVVDAILDWVGYRPDRDLARLRIVDPACGEGAFLVAVAERLSTSCREHDRPLTDALAAIRAYDLLAQHVAASRRAVERVLKSDGWPPADVDRAVRAWVTQGDYLLDVPRRVDADFVVGNPPYIRLEDVPPERMAAYRHSCATMVGRADIYVGFHEVGLRSLRPDGRLAFICADRWMRNQYGRELRAMVERDFAVQLSVTMHEVDAFDEQVSAYPAITMIAREPQGEAVLIDADRDFDADSAAVITRLLAHDPATSTTGLRFTAARLPSWFRGEYSWPTGSPDRLTFVRRLNERFRPLEDESTATRVGIGVATGADAVFITQDDAIVEADRLLPLALVRDVATGTLAWSGHYLLNPWSAAGTLVDLARFPALREHFRRHETALRSRHVGRSRPASWFRTIDKVNHQLTTRPKLLLPDMKAVIHPVLDPGTCYPHHNLYYVVSDVWDLRVLGGLLMSGVAEAFIEAYAVKMRGGTLRFQAQYLRRIRVPDPNDIDADDAAALANAFDARDRDAATDVALKVYGLDGIPR